MEKDPRTIQFPNKMEKDPRTIQFPKLQGLITMDQAIDHLSWLFEDDPQKDEVIKDVIDYYNAENLERIRNSYGILTQRIARDWHQVPSDERKNLIQMLNNKFHDIRHLGYDPTFIPEIIDRGDTKITQPAPVAWGPPIITNRPLVDPSPLTGIRGEAFPDEAIMIANAIREEIQVNVMRKILRKSGLLPDIAIEKILQATKTGPILDQVRTYTPDKGLSLFYRTAMLGDKIKTAWGSSPRVELKGGKKKKRKTKKKRSSKKKRTSKKKRSSKRK